MAVSLLSMNKDEATVAEGVTTYSRKDVETRYAAMLEQMERDQKRLPELQKELEETQKRIEANAYTLDLFGALIEAFNRDYPKEVKAAQAKEENQEKQKVSEIPEKQVEESPDDEVGDMSEGDSDE